jgi:putative membrane protein
MLKQVIVVWLVVAAAIAATAALVPSVDIDGGVLALLGVALLFGLVNALVGPLVRLVSAPLNVVTLGLFGLVVNGVLLAITAGLSDALDVGGFLTTMLAAILISAFTTLLLLVTTTAREPQPAS